MLVVAAGAGLLAVADILELPPIAVAILEIECVGAVHLGDAHHFLNAVFLFVLQRQFARAIDLFLGREIDAPMIADTDRPDILTFLETNESEIATFADHHRFRRVTHAFEAEEFLVEGARVREILAFERTVRKNFRTIERRDAGLHRFLTDRLIHDILPREFVIAPFVSSRAIAAVASRNVVLPYLNHNVATKNLLP